MVIGITSKSQHEAKRIAFIYWGRRGALSRFTLSLAETASAMEGLSPLISVSRSNELFSSYEPFSEILLPVETFRAGRGAILNLWRIPALRRALAVGFRQHGIQAAVVLMPHVWSPLVAKTIKRTGVKYAVIIHDADPHPGDPTGLVTRWLLRDIKFADRIVTLTKTVATRLSVRYSVPSSRITSLFHPDFHNELICPRTRHANAPLRMLFFGRILPYKGLSLFVDAAERLKSAGVPIKIGIFGEGPLGIESSRLSALDAEVANYWIPDSDVGAVLARYDVMVLSHVEASQSGCVAAAFGSGMPVVATPVGGLKEQIVHDVTGIIANRPDAQSLAMAIRRLAGEDGLYEKISARIVATRNERSMERFVRGVVSAIIPGD